MYCNSKSNTPGLRGKPRVVDLLPPDNVKMVGMDDDGGGGGLEAALRPVPRDKVIFCAYFPPEEGPTRQ